MKTVYPIEKPVLKGFFNCPKCKHKMPDIIITCANCGFKLNSNEKIRKLVITLQEEEAKCKSINKRLKEMNLLFSKVVKWNYHQVFKFRNKSFNKINRLIHKWQDKKRYAIIHFNHKLNEYYSLCHATKMDKSRLTKDEDKVTCSLCRHLLMRDK